jgi:hypothetical protein
VRSRGRSRRFSSLIFAKRFGWTPHPTCVGGIHFVFVGDLRLPNRVVLARLTRTRASAGRVPNSMMADYDRLRIWEDIGSRAAMLDRAP